MGVENMHIWLISNMMTKVSYHLQIVKTQVETETRFVLDSHGRGGGQDAQNVHGFL